MKNLKAILFEDSTVKPGLILITISAGLLLMEGAGLFELTEGTAFGAFCFNYSASLVFFFVVIYK
ncbi:hypothetical protein J3L18_19090 [Mucilaginibacter gossypii]|uniref:hypothetical protein n=1 Tax=Mucilaginibacter gossypii TaxID=551996 RepID=UPI000DCE9B3D|nr:MULTISPECIES: hypothetical protein [Mucilaginibacter]QTE35246.1 hypothetical protein J3L18_19090 [Mucilaginibacter gossypii]RAV58131.1 hypothetical protein DIU36_10425 [Mucilaginibacter rubeus]